MTSRSSRVSAGMGYTGIPALVFFELAHYAKDGKTYEEDRKTLHKIYAYLKTYVPKVLYSGKNGEYNKDIHTLMTDAFERTERTREMYQGMFEGKSCTSDEKTFQKEMDGLFEVLSDIVTTSKIIDKVKPEGEDMVF
jgi:hypothetical protein